VRACVEHPFPIVKNLFRHRKTRYRGLAENAHQPHTLFGLANMMIAARRTAAEGRRRGNRPARRRETALPYTPGRHLPHSAFPPLQTPAPGFFSENRQSGYVQRFPRVRKGGRFRGISDGRGFSDGASEATATPADAN
jgi:hypothetical protein